MVNHKKLMKGVNVMSEREKEALETILKAVPQMSEFQKGRLYGIAETMEEQNKSEEQKQEES